MYDIMGNSGGKVQILGGDSIGHCDKKVHMSNSEWLLSYSSLNLQIQKQWL
jgi:hypothetical protein